MVRVLVLGILVLFLGLGLWALVSAFVVVSVIFAGFWDLPSSTRCVGLV